MTLGQIENKIARYEAIRDTMTNEADRRAMDETILSLMRDAMDIRKEEQYRALDRGLREHEAWHDTSAELN
jgi:hypothetical protein